MGSKPGIPAFKPRILSVDDVDSNNKLIALYLSGQPYVVDLVASADEALRAMKKQQYHLFLLDVMMADMDGFELAQRIRRMKSYQTTPILFLTALFADNKSIIKGYELGAVDYLLKPVQQEILRMKIGTLLIMEKQRHELEWYRRLFLDQQS